MAWVEQQRSGRHRAMYRDAGKRRRSAGTYATHKEALREAWAAEDEARKDPLKIDPRDGRATWAVFVADWWERRRVEPSTANRDLARRRKHLDPVWGPVPLNKIRREDIQRWLIDLERKGLKPATISRCFTLLSSSMRAAVRERRISVSPCDDIDLPKIGPGSERFLTRDEVSRIAAVMVEPYRSVFLVLVGTGMRWGEMAGLHWQHVNLEAGHIDVVDAWDSITRECKGYTKSGSRRRVWLSDWVTDVIAQHAVRYPPRRVCGIRHRAGSTCRSGLVFPGRRDGGILQYNVYYKRHWGKAVGRPMWQALGDPVPGRTFVTPSAGKHVRGLEDAELVKVWEEGAAHVGPVRVHDCRHTFASWLVQAGVPLLDVAQQLGHSHSATAARYGHLGSSSRDRVRSAMAWAVPAPEESISRMADADQTPSRGVTPDHDAAPDEDAL